jgi:hypothetical protein
VDKNMSGDNLTLWEQFGQYLTTKIEIGESKSYKPIAYTRLPEYQATEVTVTVTNTAPDICAWPKIVFTGISLELKDARNPKLLNLPKWTRDIKITGPCTDANGCNKFADDKHAANGGFLVVSGSPYSYATQDELRFGPMAFPGQSVKYELPVPSEDLKYINFRIEATIFRRHFFHYQQDIDISK